MRVHIPRWRQKVYVHPIQRKFFFLSLVPLIVCAFLLILLVFFPLKLAIQGLVAAPGPTHSLGEAYALAVRMWPAFLISMLASCLLSFVVTHKFAGPLYRIEQVLRRAAEGDLPPSVRLRRRDDLQEFAVVLDRAFGAVTSALKAIQEHEARAGDELAALRRKVQTGLTDPKETLDRLEAIGRCLKEIANSLAAFRFPGREGEDRPAGQPAHSPGSLPHA